MRNFIFILTVALFLSSCKKDELKDLKLEGNFYEETGSSAASLNVSKSFINGKVVARLSILFNDNVKLEEVSTIIIYRNNAVIEREYVEDRGIIYNDAVWTLNPAGKTFSYYIVPVDIYGNSGTPTETKTIQF